MRIVDANLLIYASEASFPQHDAARDWLDGAINGRERLGLPWPSLLAFVRIVSNPRVFARPSSVADAWQQAERWLAGPRVWVPLPTDRHREVLGELLTATSVQSAHVSDAHLAALAVEHGLILCSTDGDFARFSSLRWENPLA